MLTEVNTAKDYLLKKFSGGVPAGSYVIPRDKKVFMIVTITEDGGMRGFMPVKDRTDRPLKNGDTIDLHQTVNGQHLFVVIDAEAGDVRYFNDKTRKYEYSVVDMLAPDQITGETEWEII